MKDFIELCRKSDPTLVLYGMDSGPETEAYSAHLEDCRRVKNPQEIENLGVMYRHAIERNDKSLWFKRREFYVTTMARMYLLYFAITKKYNPELSEIQSIARDLSSVLPEPQVQKMIEDAIDLFQQFQSR